MRTASLNATRRPNRGTIRLNDAFAHVAGTGRPLLRRTHHETCGLLVAIGPYSRLRPYDVPLVAHLCPALDFHRRAIPARQPFAFAPESEPPPSCVPTEASRVSVPGAPAFFPMETPARRPLQSSAVYRSPPHVFQLRCNQSCLAGPPGLVGNRPQSCKLIPSTDRESNPAPFCSASGKKSSLLLV